MNDVKRTLAALLLAGAALGAGGAPQAAAEDGLGLVGLLGLHDGSKGGDGTSVTIGGNDSVSEIG
ncbi:hypothetical protein ACF065_23905 [Streptomyces sp. NPDC015232]|uniref:hypothetical protein n=1 Tax=unclassified Streptomyces TaxID=2593676 RepID=UPI0033AEBC0B